MFQPCARYFWSHNQNWYIGGKCVVIFRILHAMRLSICLRLIKCSARHFRIFFVAFPHPRRALLTLLLSSEFQRTLGYAHILTSATRLLCVLWHVATSREPPLPFSLSFTLQSEYSQNAGIVVLFSRYSAAIRDFHSINNRVRNYSVVEFTLILSLRYFILLGIFISLH